MSNDGGTLVKIAPPSGEFGTWKRATKVSDTLYNQVIAEVVDAIVKIMYMPKSVFYKLTAQLITTLLTPTSGAVKNSTYKVVAS